MTTPYDFNMGYKTEQMKFALNYRVSEDKPED